MNTSGKNVAGKILYSLLFMAALPALLWWWATAAAHAVSLPAVQSITWGAVVTALGASLLLTGMYALWTFGGGLPMNAFPPPRYVQEGVYRFLPHPIYIGFSLICWGVSIYTGSAAGFWLVSPIAALGVVALVMGYENPDLRRRFPDANFQFQLGIPPGETAAPAWYHRLAIYATALLPLWLFLGILGWASTGRDRLEPYFLLPENLLSQTWSPVFAAIALFWVLLAPLVAKTRQQLRHFYIDAWVGGLTLVYACLLVPAAGSAHWLTGSSIDRWSIGALFSVAWFWIWLAAEVYGAVFPKAQKGIYTISFLLTLALLLNGIDPLVNILAGSAALIIALFHPLIWEFLREQAEKVANSWREWHFGPVRVINHGFYVGAATFGGMLIAGGLAGEEYVTGTVVFGIIGVVCAGLWGQFIEGSDKLKRPFGYYGSIVGIGIAVFVLHWMGLDVWVMLALFSVFMPWVQAIGRLRCLVNGCCHGAPASERLGIRYYHPRSRVCYLSHLKGKSLHPTQLYSMLWLALAGGIQWRLWSGGAEPSLIFATYLIGNGLGRFVEEAYRGEPQTPVFAGLRLYQWAATASVLIGIVLSTIPTVWPALNPGLRWPSVAWGLFMWAFVQFLMGIDFPHSQKRFSRLA